MKRSGLRGLPDGCGLWAVGCCPTSGHTALPLLPSQQDLGQSRGWIFTVSHCVFSLSSLCLFCNSNNGRTEQLEMSGEGHKT